MIIDTRLTILHAFVEFQLFWHPTDPFATFELLNPFRDFPQQHTIRRSRDLEAQKL